MTTTVLTSTVPTIPSPAARLGATARVRPVGARFPRRPLGGTGPAGSAVTSVLALPIGSRFPRRSAAERGGRTVLGYTPPSGAPVGARFRGRDA